MTRLAVATLCLALLAGCGGGGDKTVAEGGGRPLAPQQLDALVAPLRREGKQEGKEVPADDTKAFVQLRNRLLGLLVYREELKQAAERLGVEVSRDELAQRLKAVPGAETEGDPNGDTFARDTVEVQLLVEGIFSKVTRGV